jgi:hypothetical protein
MMACSFGFSALGADGGRRMGISKRPGAARLVLLAAGLALALGCGAKPKPAPAAFTSPLESRLILQVPYYADERGAGGPAALASVMTFNGRPATVDEVVLHLGEKPPPPLALAVRARQAEMKADFFLGGTPEALLEAVRNNQPLIVRLDGAVPPVPPGEYAVVVGYTPEGPVLNSGTVNQQIVPWAGFLTAWRQAGNLVIRIAPL